MASPEGIRSHIHRTLALATPLILAQLTGVLMTFVDTVMSGRLSAEALASVATGAAVWHTVYLFGMGLLLAVSAMVAQLDGAGRHDEIGPVVRQSFWIALAMAVLSCAVFLGVGPLLRALAIEPALHPTILGYLAALVWGAPAMYLFFSLRFLCEGMGTTKPIMVFGIVGLGVNVVANYALIYGKWGMPALGAIGCGYATSAVWWVELIGLLLYLRWHQRFQALGPWTFVRPDPRTLAEILRIGLPIGSSFFVEVSMFATVALMMGTIGTVPVAAHQIAINVASITFMLSLGVALATTVRVGNARGRSDQLESARAGWVGIGMAMTAQTGAALVLLLGRRQLAAIYTNNAEVAVLAAEFILLAAIFQLSDSLQVSAAGALRGLKDTAGPMVITVVAYWIVGLPLGYWLAFNQNLGPRGLWFGLIAGLSVAGVLLVDRFRRLSRQSQNAP